MKTLWSSPWMAVRQDGDGDEFIDAGEEVLVIAIAPDGAVLFVEEPSPAFGDQRLFLPQGAIESGEDALAAGQRELREETGFGSHQVQLIGIFNAWPKYLRSTSHVVLAEDLYSAPLAADERHPIVVHRRSRAVVEAAIAAGEEHDGRTIAVFSLLRSHEAR